MTVEGLGFRARPLPGVSWTSAQAPSDTENLSWSLIWWTGEFFVLDTSKQVVLRAVGLIALISRGFPHV